MFKIIDNMNLFSIFLLFLLLNEASSQVAVKVYDNTKKAYGA
jgi:hypothetical protein